MAAGAGKVSRGGGGAGAAGPVVASGLQIPAARPRRGEAGELGAAVGAGGGRLRRAGAEAGGHRRLTAVCCGVSLPGRKVSCLSRRSLSVSHPPRAVEAAADSARGLQASPPAAGPASLPHLLVRREPRLPSLGCDPRGGGPEKRRPGCCPGAQAARDRLPAGGDPRAFPGVVPSAVRIPALVAGTPARCPGVPARPPPVPPRVPVPRAQDPGHRRLGWCGPGTPCHLPAASAHRGQMRTVPPAV